MTMESFERLEKKIGNVVTMKTSIEEITLRSGKWVGSKDISNYLYK